MEVKIQTASMDNLADIQKLNQLLCKKENEEFDATIDPNYPMSEEGKEYFTESIQDDCALVAIADNKVVGYLVGAISDVEDYRNISKVAEAENMFVLEKYRSEGIGAQLFEKFMEWSKEQNADRVRAVASAQNQKAIDFYKKQGFNDYDLVLEKEL